VELTPLARTYDEASYHYEYVDVELDPPGRTATLTICAPKTPAPQTIDEILDAGAGWWPLQMARELDDAILTLRTNHMEIGLWIFKTKGDSHTVRETETALLAHGDHWFVREVLGMMRRTFARIDVSSRSIYAIIEPGSCFAGCLLELALAADRVYMLDDPRVSVYLSETNFGSLPAVSGLSRLEARFYRDPRPLANLRSCIGQRLGSRQASQLGLVTFAPDELDWADEIRQAIEGRTALSPDAMTGLEANLRFGTVETMESRIFGRLSAWQNWIFVRPNAVGPNGALKVYGTGNRAKFDWGRI
jgi:benzoyl-CoA-dihydrodiol lyase